MLINCNLSNIILKRIDESTQIPQYSKYIILPKEGKVYSLKTNKFIGSNKNPKGYWQCNIYDNNGKRFSTKIHRIIWISVNGEIPAHLQINHIDENKNNNTINNLNLMTPKENNNWGTRKERAGKSISKAIRGRKLSVITKNKISIAHTNNKKLSKPVGAFKDGVLILSFPSVGEAGRNGFHSGAITECCNNKNNRKTHRGYIWQYLN